MRVNINCLLLIDFLTLCIAFLLGQLPRFHEFSWSLDTWWHLEGQFRIYGFLLTVGSVLFVFGFICQHYTERKPFWDELRENLKVLSILMILDAALFFFNKIHFSRVAFAIQWLSIFCLLPILRTSVKLYVLKIGKWQIPVRLIGNGENAKEAWLTLKSEKLMGYELAEVVQTSQINRDDAWITVPTVSWQEGLTPIQNIQVVIALEAAQQAELDEVVRVLSRFYPNMIIVPPTRGLPLWGMQPLHSFSHEVLLLRAQNSLLRPSARLIKRSFDVCVSFILLLLLSPLFLYLFYKVKQTDGDVFFGHQRIGVNGKPFPCYKFRTMVKNSADVLAELLKNDVQARAEWEAEFKLKNDPRITQIGHVLRRTSLDELPQLWNVLCGEMSLVGPRPVVHAELAKYGNDVDYYLHVKPGMTGLWQVSGRNDVDYEVRVALDAWYVRNWSLWHDLVILIKTVKVVLARDGAY